MTRASMQGIHFPNYSIDVYIHYDSELSIATRENEAKACERKRDE